MALSMRTVIFSLVVLVALLTIPIMIGVYVYRDAKRRGMNAMAWTLIAVVAPALIGFIIYLLICSAPSAPNPLQNNMSSALTVEQSCAPPAQTARSRWKRIGKCALSALLRWRVWRHLLLRPSDRGTGRWVKS